MTELKAPDGNLIHGIVQKTGLIAGLNWTAVTGLASGDDLNFGQYAVFEDVDGGRWLFHHLIPEDQPPKPKSVITAMESEVAWRHRASLLCELASTFLVDSTNYRYWDDMAGEWIERADSIRDALPGMIPTLRPDAQPFIDPDPDQWPGGDITGHPGYSPEVLMTTDCPPCQVLAGETNLGTMRSLDIANPWNISQHRQDLMTVAAEAMLLRQTVDNVHLFNPAATKMVMDRIADLFGMLTMALQKEAIARDLTERGVR